jgi:IS5 family transposase
MGQLGFWDWEDRQKKLASQKALLLRLDEIIPWSEFREILLKIHDKDRKSSAGRKATDPILLFKMLILQQLYNISDEELEYQVNDRLSFMNFLGLSLGEKVPDRTTIWLFRQNLTDKGIISELFDQFEQYLRNHGYQAKGGQILDATLVPVPKQRNTREDNKTIKEGKVPEDWQHHPKKLAQKDTDARWTQKNGKNHYGYKNHLSCDVDYGFIRQYEVSDAAVHDSQKLAEILDFNNEGAGVWADSAYRSKAREKALADIGFESHIHEKASKKHPLKEEQKQSNRIKSTIRAKVEHIFGYQVMSMGGKLLRSIGIVRAKANLGLKNLVYNFQRLVFWEVKYL